MDDITIRSALDEVAHRLEQLKKKLPELVGKTNRDIWNRTEYPAGA